MEPEPCQCLTSFAVVSPIHPGHCCFLPASQTCHREEVAEWERQRDRRLPDDVEKAVREQLEDGHA